MLYNEEIEQQFLGCLLLDPKCFDSVAWFSSAFFYTPVHGRIFDAIKLHKTQGRDYCPDLIAQFFSDDEGLIEAGGSQYLKDLAADVLSTLTIKSNANYLLSLHYRRMANAAGERIQKLAINADIETPPERILHDLDLILADARNLKTRDNIKNAAEGIAGAIELARNPKYGVNSGFGKLHKITGGFKPTELITIGGRPGMGKTALGLTLAVNAAKEGKRVLFFSLEMSHQQLWQRILSRLSRAPLHSGNLHDDEWAEVDKAANDAHTLPIDIDDSPSLTALEICARAAQYKRKNGLDLIVIDYLGFIKASDPKANKVHQIEEITGSLKALAKTQNVPVVLLCQLSRAVEGKDDKRPGLSDLRDSGCIEQDSDMVMFIYRDEYYTKKKDSRIKSASAEAYDMADENAMKGKAELIVAKNRQNVLGTIDLQFSGERQEFYE